LGLSIYLFSWDSKNTSRRGNPYLALLEQAAKYGDVRIKRKDGQVFVIRVEPETESPWMWKVFTSL
jgi:hypothetical protein